MRVLHLMHHLAWGGGVESYVLNLLPRLEALGHEQAVAYVEGDPSLAREAYAMDVSFGRDARGRMSVEAIIEQFKPDLTHVHNIFYPGLVEPCFQHGPVVATAHGYQWLCPAEDFFQHRPQKVCSRRAGPGCLVQTLQHNCMSPRLRAARESFRRVRYGRKNAKRFHRLIAPCQYCADRHVQDGFPQERVQVLPYFCPVEPLAEPRDLPDEPLITFMGRVRDYKGYGVFIEALGQLPDSVRGLIVGDVATRLEEIQHRAEDAGCRERLTIKAWADREEIRAIFESTSVFVFPSLWPETLGIVGLEAMAHGVPVVASSLGGPLDWLQPEVTGLFSEAGDAAGFAAALKRMLEDSTMTEAMGRAAIQAIHEHYLPEQHIRALLEIYQSAA